LPGRRCRRGPASDERVMMRPLTSSPRLALARQSTAAKCDGAKWPFRCHSDHVVPVGLSMLNESCPQDAGVVHQNVERPVSSTAGRPRSSPRPRADVVAVDGGGCPPQGDRVHDFLGRRAVIALTPAATPAHVVHDHGRTFVRRWIASSRRSPPAPVRSPLFVQQSIGVLSFGERVRHSMRGAMSGAAGAACSTPASRQDRYDAQRRRVLEPHLFESARLGRAGCAVALRSGLTSVTSEPGGQESSAPGATSPVMHSTGWTARATTPPRLAVERGGVEAALASDDLGRHLRGQRATLAARTS